MAEHLVVDSRHLDPVVAVLREGIGLAVGDVERSDALDLARVGLPDLAAYRATAVERHVNELLARRGSLTDISGLDVLLMDLRTRFARDHGWLPLVDDDAEAAVGLPQHKALPVTPTPVTQAPAVHAEPDDGAGVHVGVVDTAFYDVLPGAVGGDRQDGGDTSIMSVHGTFVCGLVQQSAPAARITVAGALDGKGRNTVWDVATRMAVVFAEDRPHVVNMSLGADNDDPHAPLALRRVLDWLGPRVLVVAAAGNRQHLTPSPAEIWPAAATDVTAVGAADGFFSMRRPWVDLVAPGVGVVSTWVPDVELDGERARFASWSGTSFAAPQVTGAVAALMSRNPGMTAHEAVKAVPGHGNWPVVGYIHGA